MEPIDAETIDRDDDEFDDAPEQPNALTLRRPDVPTSLNQLAALKGEATEVVQARALVLTTLRTAAIRMTSPEDWLLFKAPDEQGGQVVGYLQDCGCDRVRDLYGIEVFDISKPERVTANDGESFMYLLEGSGRCKVTRQTVEVMEGGRSSTDDFCRGKEGAELELAVRKAARANLDGNVTRELAGMKSVPAEELIRAWEGTPKKIEQCRRGRGFGSRSERLGANSEKAPDVEPPVCPHCGTKGVYRPGKDNRGAFYGCPKFKSHEDKRWIVDAEKWQREQAAKAAPATAAAAPATEHKTQQRQAARPAAASTQPTLTADDVFGGREPGSDG